MRLPVLDVMVHPWVTVQETAPLVPYTKPPVDEKLRDKVLAKTSQLINMDKSKIAFHVQQKRYDAISGVYNLLLDEELRRLSTSNNNDRGRSDEEGSPIRVSFKPIMSDGNDNGAQGPKSESATSSEGQDSPTEQDWEQAPTRKHMAHKPNEPKLRALGNLRITGFKICTKEARSHKRRPQGYHNARTRPNSANPQRAPEKTSLSPKRNMGASRAWQRSGKTRCKSCIPRFAPRFDRELQVKRAVLSPRVRQDPALLASQWETKLKALISDEGQERDGNSEEGANSGPCVAGDNHIEPATISAPVPIVKSDANLEQGGDTENWRPLEYTGAKKSHLGGTSGVKQTNESNKSEENKTVQTLQTNQRFISSRGSVRSPNTEAKKPPSSLATQNANRTVSPLKTSQFVDLADYHKYVPQPPKSSIAGLGGPSKLAVKDDKTERKIDSYSAVHQSFLKDNKPQHLRQSIMQAHEILQHESTFHAKYGRRLSTEASASNASNADSNKHPENQASRFSHASIGTPSNTPVPKKTNEQQLNIPKPGYLKGVGLRRDKKDLLVCGVYKQDESSHDHTFELCPSAERVLHENNPTNADVEKVVSGKEGHSEGKVIEIRLKPKQEESMKRQKEKEQMESNERERLRFLKELEDQDRQKIITEHLQHMYSQHGQTPSPHAGNKKSEHNTRTYKMSKHGRVFPVATRPAGEQNPRVPRVITKKAPIWHETARGSQGDRKISFKAKQGVTGSNAVRFFNEWNNSLFTEYINSSDGDTEMGKEKDKLQNASFWIEQHLNGVLDETSVRRDLHKHPRLIPRET